jgi:hypothetical protein
LGQEDGPLLLQKEIALPGVEGWIDHFSVDVPGQTRIHRKEDQPLAWFGNNIFTFKYFVGG